MSAMTWRKFGLGLFGAVVNSISNAVTVLIVDPNTFNPFGSGDWRKLASCMIVSGLVGAFLWLKQHPIPGSVEDV